LANYLLNPASKEADRGADMTMSSLRQILPANSSAELSVEAAQGRIGRLTIERQHLREIEAGDAILERNRLELVEAQLELSHALIARYLRQAA
jgi:hypothetical protein